MYKSEKLLLKFIIFIFFAVLIFCEEARESEIGNENFFIYDTTKVDELVEGIKELNKKLVEIDNTQQVNALMKKITALEDQNSELSRKLEAYQKEEDEKLNNIIDKLNKLDESLIEVKTENQKSSQQLQDLGFTLDELKEIELKESATLKNLKETQCGLSNSTIAVNVMNLNQFNDQLKTFLNVPSAAYSGCEKAVKYNGYSGVYSFRIPNTKFSTFKAYCLEDPKDEGSAWTIIQRRDENSGHFIDFNRTWKGYKSGFGDLEHDHWLGLDNIFTLTNLIGHEFWEKVVNEKGEIYNAYYNNFKIGDEDKNFTMTSINSDISNLNVLSCLNTPFNTFDRGNTTWVNSKGNGGFWGPCEINYNGQKRKNSELQLSLTFSEIHATYVHLAIRRKTN